MKFTFHVLDVAIEMEATPEEVLAVAGVFTPASLVKTVIGAVGEAKQAKAAVMGALAEKSLQ